MTKKPSKKGNENKLDGRQIPSVLDESIPTDLIISLLENSTKSKFDTESLLPKIANIVGWYRFDLHITENNLKPSEHADWAESTANSIKDLRTRLCEVHPDIECWLDELLFLSGSLGDKSYFFEIQQRVDSDLIRLDVALSHAAERLRGRGKPGPDHSNWRSAKEKIAELLRECSTPSLQRTGHLALRIMEKCDLKPPAKKASSR